MHLLIYDMRPDIQAVVHAHPAYATAYAAAGIPLNKALISEVVLALGCIPLTRVRHARHARTDRPAAAVHRQLRRACCWPITAS